MVHVSEIHAAGGLSQWMRKQAEDVKNPHDVQRRATKTAQAIDDVARVKCEAKKRNSDVPTEHEEQVAFIKWAEGKLKPNVFAMLFAIPNGGQRSKAVAGKLKAEGVKPGIPDLMLAVPRDGYHGLFVEMKKAKGGSVSPSQAKMVLKLQAEGYQVEICRGRDEAIVAVQTYLEPEDWR